MLAVVVVLDSGAGAVTAKTKIVCDGCEKEISRQVPTQYLALSATTLGLLLETKHFCKIVCLHAWAARVLEFERG